MVADLGILEPDGLHSLHAETLKAPESRIRSASAVRSRITELKAAEKTRAARRAKIQGLLDGNRPYNQQTLRDKGQGHRTNLNRREGEGWANSAKTPYYDVAMENERPINVVLDYGEDPWRTLEWSTTVSEELKELIDRWDGYDFNTQLVQWQMCVFGVGHMVFEKRMDWRPRARKVGDVLVPDGTSADLDELEECAIPRTMMPVQLYRLIEKEEAAKTAGWFVERAKRAIVNAATQSFKDANGDHWSEEYQTSLRCGDVAWNSKSSRIHVVDYLIKEFDGTITKAIVLDDGTGNITLDPGKDQDGFLFKKKKCFDSFSEVICPFFFDIGTGEWHSIKGLGPKIYDFCEVLNRLGSGTIDGARMGSALVLQAGDANATQQTQINEMGGAFVVQPGYTVVQNKIAESLQGPLAVMRDIQNTLQSNTGEYRQRVSAEDMEPTLGQAQLNAASQSRLSKAAINRYCKSLDRMYREMVRRIFNPKLTKNDPGGKEALEFIDKCVARGVPKEALAFDKICSIKASRPFGHGSEQMRMVLADKVVAMLPTMNERSRNTALRMWAAAYFGQHVANQLYPAFDTPQQADDHIGMATLENNILRQMGGEVVRTPSQDDATHFTVHFADTQETVTDLQAGKVQPMQALVHLHQAGPHMKQHLDAIAGDPTRKDQVGQMQQAWLALSKVADQLQQQIAEAAKAEAQAEAQEPKISEEHAREMLSIQLEHQRKVMKLQGDMAIKADKHVATKALKDLQTADSIRRKNAELVLTAQEQAANVERSTSNVQRPTAEVAA